MKLSNLFKLSLFIAVFAIVATGCSNKAGDSKAAETSDEATKDGLDENNRYR